ncbi:RCC1 domain-containing protein [Amycolatopsis lexingtonensis]|uniref:RCC1 domain-containing protein n=1 Tax=Amycolatopsis lexingtonensis TaxID=218822 RepID=UPI003F723DC0
MAVSRPLALVVALVAALVPGVIGVSGAAAAVTSPASSFTAVQPTRFLDTVRGVGIPVGAVGAKTTVTGSAASLAPVNTTAVVVNLWAESPSADSAITAFTHGQARPALPSLQVQAGKRRSNQVTVQVGADRTVDFYNEAGSVHLIASIVGYYTTDAGSRYTPVSPSRLLIDWLGNGTTTKLSLAHEVPATATAVTFALTLTNPSAATYATVFPHSTPRPTMANVAAYPGGQGTNLVTVKIGADRSIDFYNLAGQVESYADLVGFYATDYGAYFTPVAPERVLDSRSGLGTWDGKPRKIGANTDIAYRLQPSIPSNALAVALNVTGYSATATTAVTAWDLPSSSQPDPGLSLAPGQTISVAAAPVVSAVGPAVNASYDTDRSVYVHNRTGTVDVTADLAGYFTLPPADCLNQCVSTWSSYSWHQGTGYIGTPKPMAGLSDVVAIAGSISHGYALRIDGTVRAWGHNWTGELGNGWFSGASRAPVPVVGLTSVTAIAAGDAEGFARRSDGTVWQWGQTVDAPVQVAGLTGVTAIAAARDTAYAVKSDGTVWAWGSNTRGELGNGSTAASSATPVRVSGLSGVQAISSGDGYSAYAVKTDGTVWAWGDNTHNELGNGVACATSSCLSRTPVPVSGLTGVTAVTGNWSAAYALKSDGTVVAWGANDRGRLGNGVSCESTDTGPNCTSAVPVPVSGLTGAKAIGIFNGGAYAVKTDGTVWGWGDNHELELGQGVTAYPWWATVPVQVPGLSRVKAVASGLALGE